MKKIFFAVLLLSSIARAGDVPVRRTPVEIVDAANAIAAAWSRRTGQAVDDQTLYILLAQFCHETNDGKNVYGFNFAGIKASKGEKAMRLMTSEGWGSKKRITRDRFRVFDSVEDGADGYVGFLVKNFPLASVCAYLGQVSCFVSYLREGNYFTARYETYLHAIKLRVALYQKEFSTQKEPK